MQWEDNCRKYRLSRREGLALKFLVDLPATDRETGLPATDNMPTYKEIGLLLGKDTRATRKFVTQARVKFSEAVGLSPETLNFEASKGKHRPQIFQEEFELLREHFGTKTHVEASLDFTDRLLARAGFLTPDKKKQWTDAIEQERRDSGKRHR